MTHFKKAFLGIVSVALVLPIGLATSAASANQVKPTLTFTKMVKGKCAPDQIKTKMGKTQKVNWQWKNGNIGKKTVKKGQTVCKFTNAAGQSATAPTNSAGVMTALPSTFPKNPSASDIKNLGLTPESKVAPNLRIPQPTGAPLAKGELPDKVRPQRVVSVRDGFYEWGGYPIKYITVEWEFTGGSGTVSYLNNNDINNDSGLTQQNVALNPSGTTRVTQTSALRADITPDQTVKGVPAHNVRFSGKILPDYGQASVPSSMTKDWKVPAVKDESGVGVPVGKYANPQYYNSDSGMPRDGIVFLTPNGEMVPVNYGGK